MPARTARPDRRGQLPATPDRAHREDRQLLFQPVAVAGRTLEPRALAHEQFEAVLAVLAAIFEERHWTEDTAGPGTNLGPARGGDR